MPRGLKLQSFRRALLKDQRSSLARRQLLTDADAVFDILPPFLVFPPDADLVVACDATVVPANWKEAPGMVMAGFFYARAGPRPIILLKEVCHLWQHFCRRSCPLHSTSVLACHVLTWQVLDYQLRHPEQHDQQSFNQILSELLVRLAPSPNPKPQPSSLCAPNARASARVPASSPT